MTSKLINDKLCNTWIGLLINRLIAYVELKVMNYYHDKQVMDLIKQIIREDKDLIQSRKDKINNFKTNASDIIRKEKSKKESKPEEKKEKPVPNR